MSRFASLAGKELREHWLAGLFLSGLLGIAALVVLGNALVEKRQTSLFQADLFFLYTFVPLAAVVLGNRLIVAEWSNRTQLFVEALPLRRGEMVIVKWILGGALIVVANAAMVLCTALLAASSEPIDGRFLAILLARSETWTLFCWSFCFGMGFTGRFRIPLYLAIGVGLLAINAVTELELGRWGPFDLVNPTTFPSERSVYPERSLAITAGIAAGWTILGWILATTNEGSVAEVLSRRMSQKEKMVVGVLFMAGLAAVITLDERKKKKPFEFSETTVLRSERAPIAILWSSEDERPDARALLDDLERDLLELRDLFGLELPPFRVAPRSTLDARTFEKAKLADADGVLLRVNYRRRAGWDARAFSARAVREVLSHATKGRAEFEPKRWVLDGFSRWWAERGAPDPSRRALLRALWATRERPVSDGDLHAWLIARERWGEPIAESVAWSGLAALEAERGRDAVLGLARDVYGRRPYQDVRETLWERDNPMPVVFERGTGLAWPRFLEAWRAHLDRERARPENREALARVPDGEARLDIESPEGALRAVAWHLAFARPPAAGTVCALVHAPLGPFDWELERDDLRRDELVWRDGAREETRRLRGTYGPGSRAFLAVEVESDVLDAPIRIASERAEIPR